MKRSHEETIYCINSLDGKSNSMATSTTSQPSINGKLWEDDGCCSGGGGMDELLAVLGYKVRSSDMPNVAQKLEQLEMAMMGTSNQEDGISQLSSDTIHYNPSDLSGWVHTMLSELNAAPSTVYDESEYDLRAIPGSIAYPQTHSNKRVKTDSSNLQQQYSSSSSTSSYSTDDLLEPTRPVVLVNTQETGVRLVHTLLACAEAVQVDNLKLADTLLKHIGILAASQSGAMRKVAMYFAEALARRVYKIYPQDCVDQSSLDTLEMHFYETCPYLKFAHFTANQAILEAITSASNVHIIDFGLKQGMQWPALMQALALRPGGPPTFRLTGIGPPQPGNTDALQEVGWKLAQLAEAIGVKFEFRGFVANSLADIEPEMLHLQPNEIVAVNSVFELHRLLARPGGMDKVLALIKAMKPKIVTIVEQEADHNKPVFQDRFTGSLHYYSTLFDSLEGSGSGTGLGSNVDLVMSEFYLGRQICNVVACEGTDRVERHELLTQWKTRMESSGFNPVHLGSNAFKQASTLLAVFAGGDGYRVEENNGCLMLGWHTRPLIATSAWQLAPVNQ